MNKTIAIPPDQHSYAQQFCCSLLLTLIMLSPGIVFADHAYMDGGLVYLPVVEDYAYNSSYELRQVRGSSPREFVLEWEGDAEGPVTAASAYYDGDILVIPELWLADKSYWAELRQLSPRRFRLFDYGRNQQWELPPAGAYEHQFWERIPGQARDIGVGADGTVWAVGENDIDYDYGLWHWDGQRWYENAGSALRVDVDAWGRPWVINDDNEIHVLEHGFWERIHGGATDIGVGADGSVWVTGVKERNGGYEIYTLGEYGWIRVEGSAVRIDVAPDGTPWVINHDDQIYRLENGRWRRIPGKAKDIGIGADGTVWVIGTNDRSGGYGIYKYTGSGWRKIDGSARQISVGPDGAPWVVNREGDIYRSHGY